MIYFICLFFGLAPSLIWLFFYLKKDAHPEPKRMVVKVFFFGMIVALMAAGVEILIQAFLNFTHSSDFMPHIVFYILYYFIGIAFVEEFLKYFVVKQKILNDPEFDEPTDAMIYMIITALGFAALENILVLLTGQGTFNLLEIAAVTSLRFIGATFLHALCSGVVGFFLALSIFEPQKKGALIILGLIIATTLHGLYNFFIMRLDENFYLIYILITILTALAFFVSFAFRKLKKIASVCEIKK